MFSHSPRRFTVRRLFSLTLFLCLGSTASGLFAQTTVGAKGEASQALRAIFDVGERMEREQPTKACVSTQGFVLIQDSTPS